jgi:hypothetical protein
MFAITWTNFWVKMLAIISRFIWLRNFEVGNNSAAANRCSTGSNFCMPTDINHSALASIPAHRIARLRRQGELLRRFA